MKKIYKAKTFFELSFAALFCAALLSCSALGDDGGALALAGFQGGGAQSGQTRVATVSGSVGLGGAYPAQAAALVSQSNALNAGNVIDISKAAFPNGEPPEGEIAYSIWAESSTDPGEKYSADIALDKKSYTIAIPIPEDAAGKKYKIKGTVSCDGKIFLSGVSAEFTIKTATPVAEQDLVLCGAVSLDPYGMPTETGSVALEIQVEAETHITSCSAHIEGLEHGLTLAVSDGKIKVETDGVPSGSRRADFVFMDSSSNMIYSFTDWLNVCDNMVTNVWDTSNALPWIEVSEDAEGNKTAVCKITADLLKSLELWEIYVDTSRQPYATTYDSYTTESGTWRNPCATLEKAFELMKNPDTDYLVRIKAIPKDPDNDDDLNKCLLHVEIGASLGSAAGPGVTSLAHSVTLMGTSGFDDSGEPLDVITSGADESHTATSLTIKTRVPIIIKNLKITGGWNHDATTMGGGGIYSKGNLTLSSGAYVVGNKTTNCPGAGIYNDNGTLLIEAGAVIKNNSALGISDDGGGVFSYGGSVTMTGGTIAGNYAKNNGGGVCCEDASFTMKGGVIGDAGATEVAAAADRSNFAEKKGGGIYFTSELDEKQCLITGGAIVYNATGETSGYGGGVYADNGIVTLSSGIYYNYGYDGGGVYVTKDATVTIDGARLEANEAGDGGGAIYVDRRGVLNMLGAAYIPCLGENRNDIYLAGDDTLSAKINVTAPLTRSGFVAAVRPNNYIDATIPRITVEDGLDLAEQGAGKFDVVPESIGGGETQLWYFNSSGLIVTGFGTKTADVELAVNDIVFSDGTHTPYSDSLTLTAAQKRAAVAIIFYKSSGCNNTGESGARILGVGMTQQEFSKWCVLSAKAFNPKDADSNPLVIESIVCDGSSDSFTGTRNGKNNLELIAQFLNDNGLGNDTGVGENQITNPSYTAEQLYPAFWYAKNYKDQVVVGETKSRLAGASCEDGWYLPSRAELYQLYSKQSSLNNALAVCDGEKLNFDKVYWSSSTLSDTSKSDNAYVKGSFSSTISCKKSDSCGTFTSQYYCARPIRQF